MSETHYTQFYRFRSPPFHITADPSSLFATDTHHAALGALEYGVASGKGFIVVTGEVGVGKTTVLKLCLDKLDPDKVVIIYIFNPRLEIQELYETVLESLDAGIAAARKGTSNLHRLHRALLTANKAGKQVILAVDEAQNMPEQTLESLRMLSNFETAKAKLLQIILVGQPELDEILARQSLRQLRQRVAVRSRITPLTFRQTRLYIKHRVQCAGRSDENPLFTMAALWYLAYSAQGIPRTVNIHCDNALINGYGYGAHRISLRIAREACLALQFRSRWKPRKLVVAMILILSCAAVSQSLWFMRFASTVTAYMGLESKIRDRSVASLSATQAGVPIARESAQIGIQPNDVPQEPAVGGSVWPENSIETLASSAPDARSDSSAETTATVPTDEGTTGPSVEAPAIEASGTTDPKLESKWFVRNGDSVYKACKLTYGVCDSDVLRRVLAYNPQIGPDAVIRQGETISMPEPFELRRSN